MKVFKKRIEIEKLTPVKKLFSKRNTGPNDVLFLLQNISMHFVKMK
ncbi:unnamed protein product [Tenebrio molitor]|jgi:hypothetical protein|nr:unnamed protein product [Tenebrio molitor]